ncbi:hypothetical protein HNV12_13570 [Methanococcoides sp. SA1]|nr:hypothetical protein [Methanococcoides sp. SA1]
MGLEFDENFIYFAIVPVVLFFMKDLYFKNWNDRKEKRERRGLWIATLRANVAIKGCLDRFDDLCEIHGKYSTLYFTLSFILGVVLFFLLVVPEGIFNLASLDKSASFNLLLLVPVFLFAYYINKLEDKQTYNASEANHVAICYRCIYWFSYGGNVLIFSLALLLMVATDSNKITDYGEIVVTCLVIFIVLAVNYGLSKSSKNLYETHLMQLVNKEHQDKYPFVHIHTKECELAGYIQDVFDEKLITLKLNKQVTVFEWEHILVLVLDSLKQKKLIQQNR